MLHKILSTTGFGVLGIDPITAIVLLGMGMRKEKKYKITIFMATFTVLSILIGAILSTIFGSAAVDILKRLIPGDEHPFWGNLEFGISVIILVWVIIKICKPKEKKEKESKVVDGSLLKFIVTGIVFAFTCFTDPTYYAVMLLGGESHNFFTATLLLTVWFVVSQSMSFAVYFANQFGALDKLTAWLDRVKARFTGRPQKIISTVIYTILLIIGVALMANSTYFLFSGKYLF